MDELKEFIARGNVMDMAVGIPYCLEEAEVGATRCPHRGADIGA